jgi:hypothetical protein
LTPHGEQALYDARSAKALLGSGMRIGSILDEPSNSGMSLLKRTSLPRA